MEAIILSGGLGTRLREVTKDILPKTLVDIQGKPILSWILDLLQEADVDRTILAIGHHGEKIQRAFGSHYNGMKLEYSLEKEPLGTGGAVKLASERLEDPENFLVINGDAPWTFDISQLVKSHSNAYLATIGLMDVEDARDFGLIEYEGSSVKAFKEKPKSDVPVKGVCNTGIYMFNKRMIDFIPQGASSLEKDIFPTILGKLEYSIRGYRFPQGRLYPADTPEKYHSVQESWPGVKLKIKEESTEIQKRI